MTAVLAFRNGLFAQFFLSNELMRYPLKSMKYILMKVKTQIKWKENLDNRLSLYTLRYEIKLKDFDLKIKNVRKSNRNNHGFISTLSYESLDTSHIGFLGKYAKSWVYCKS